MTVDAEKTLFYLVPNDAYFLSHRLPMAAAAQETGLRVTLVTGSESCRAAIEARGVRVILCPFLTPGGMNLWREARAAAELIRIYRTHRPQVVHHITLKAILYGSLAAWLARIPHVVNAFAGLGYIFTAQSALARALRVLLLPLLRLLMARKGFLALFQNAEDRDRLVALGLVRAEAARVIPGSGIDPQAVPPLPLPSAASGIVCVYAGRMIGIKGLATLRAAFALLAADLPDVQLWLCGQPDPANPGSWSAEDLHRWERESPNVRWKGWQEDMAAIWAQGHIALQPSYGGEGIPRALLVALACARPVVASDVAGCRDVVDHGRTGLLVPPGDPHALARAIATLARDPRAMQDFGNNGRRLIEERGLSARAVMDQTRRLYESVIG